MPDWAAVHRELRRPSVTLQLLWMEHKEAHPDGHQYTQFVHHYGVGRVTSTSSSARSTRRREAVPRLRRETIPVVDPETGVGAPWELFSACWVPPTTHLRRGAAVPGAAQWIAAHVRCFAFMGGCPRILVPDYVPRHIIGPDHRGYTLELLDACS